MILLVSLLVLVLLVVGRRWRELRAPRVDARPQMRLGRERGVHVVRARQGRSRAMALLLLVGWAVPSLSSRAPFRLAVGQRARFGNNFSMGAESAEKWTGTWLVVEIPPSVADVGAAITAEVGAGKIVRLHAGATYTATTQILLDTSNFWMDGKGATVQWAGGAINSIVHVADGVTNVWNIRLENLTVSGIAGVNYAVHVENCHHSDFVNLRLRNVEDAGLYTQFSVLTNYDRIRVTSNDEAFTVAPQVGIIFGGNARGQTTAGTVKCPVIEGLPGNGIEFHESANMVVEAGTSEGNQGWGVVIYSGSKQIHFDCGDYEVNSVGDFECAGSNCVWTSVLACSAQSIVFTAASVKNTVQGGNFYHLTDTVGSNSNAFINVGVQSFGGALVSPGMVINDRTIRIGCLNLDDGTIFSNQIGGDLEIKFGGLRHRVRGNAGDLVLDGTDDVAPIDAAAAPAVVSLPEATADMVGRFFLALKIDATANALTLQPAPASGDTIDGLASISTTIQGASLYVVCQEVGLWRYLSQAALVGGKVPASQLPAATTAAVGAVRVSAAVAPVGALNAANAPATYDQTAMQAALDALSGNMEAIQSVVNAKLAADVAAGQQEASP